jgi:hypothetical protein
MNKLKRCLSILLAVLLVASTLCIVSVTANADTSYPGPTFVVETVEAEAGDTGVAINVLVKNNPGVASIALDISYDKTRLELTGFTYNTAALNGASTTPYSSSARVPCLFMVNGTQNIVGDFTFATLYFNVKDTADGICPVTIAYDEDNVYNINEDNVAFDIVNGAIVLDSTPPVSGNPTFEVGTVNANPGDTGVAVDVLVKNNPGVASIALDVNYDKNMLELTGFTYNTAALNGASTTPYSSTALVPCLFMVNGTQNVTGDFTFATLYFNVKANAVGTCPILVSYDVDNVYDINEDNVAFDIVYGAIVLDSAPVVVQKPTFEVGTVNAKPGDTGVAVDVLVKNNPGVASIALDIGYDKNMLELTGFTYNTAALAGASTTPYSSTARVPCLFMVNGTQNVTGDFTFATLYFNVKANATGTCPITIAYEADNVYDINEDNVAFEIVNGAIEVTVVSGHSVSLNGDVGVNFYLDFTPEEIQSGVTVQFDWSVGDESKHYATEVKSTDSTDNGFRVSCPIPVAEMTYEITATITCGDSVITDKYSVTDYAKTFLNADYRAKYLQDHTVTDYNELADLLKSMLSYGAMAQLQFGRNLDNLANKDLVADDAQSLLYYNPADVTADMISTGADSMADIDSQDFGLKYAGTTVVFLSESSLRHYFTVVNWDKFNEVKDNITFGGKSVQFERKGSKIYFELKNIAAAELDDLYTLTISSQSYRYSALDYVKACLDSDSITPNMKELAKATYRYNQAANTYFAHH